QRRGSPLAAPESSPAVEPRPAPFPSPAGCARRTVAAGPRALAIVACLAAALWAQPVWAQQIADLGSDIPFAINASGEAVGVTGAMQGCSGLGYPFLYSGGVVTELSTLSVGTATGINDSGQIVGQGFIAPFLYSGGVMNDLRPAGVGLAVAINNSGQIAGASSPSGLIPGLPPDSVQHAVVYSGGVLTDLGTLGGSLSVATAINASGQVAGYSMRADGTEHAFLYSNGVMRDLGTLGGALSHANAINAGGEIVGFADTADGSWHAFLYSGGFMLDLGTLGGPHSEALGINTSGQVVGYSGLAGGANNAFIYSNGVMTALNSLLPSGSQWGLMTGDSSQAGLEQANAINDNGQIAGCAYVSGAMHGFIYTLTPNLTGLRPATAAPGGASFLLTVTGTNFLPSATVNWNLEFFSMALATTYVSATQLTASVPASLIATPGMAIVTVTTSQGVSPGATLAIHPSRRSPGMPQRPKPPEAPPAVLAHRNFSQMTTE
ncbi:MAG: DUF3466 family protein, partial [Bryobacteraceae bacterium]